MHSDSSRRGISASLGELRLLPICSGASDQLVWECNMVEALIESVYRSRSGCQCGLGVGLLRSWYGVSSLPTPNRDFEGSAVSVRCLESTNKLSAHESPTRTELMDVRVAALEIRIPVQRRLSLWRSETVGSNCFKASAELIISSSQLQEQWPFGSARKAML